MKFTRKQSALYDLHRLVAYRARMYQAQKEFDDFSTTVELGEKFSDQIKHEIYKAAKEFVAAYEEAQA